MSDLKTATGLSLGSPINAIIRARNSAGWGVFSPEPTTQPDSLPISGPPTAAPTTISASSFTKSTITLQWSEVLDTGYSPITGYLVYINGGGSSTTFSLAGSTTFTTLTVTSLNALTNYTFYIIPQNLFGNGPQSSNFTQSTSQVPGTVTNLNVTQ